MSQLVDERVCQMEIVKFPLRVTFHKKDEMVYFSQLDLMRIIERALRRSNLPLVFTQGFRPHVKMSFHKALKLGIEGEIEATLYFSQRISPDELKQALSPHLPCGIEIFGVQHPTSEKNLADEEL